jgi:hypothetical protein
MSRQVHHQQPVHQQQKPPLLQDTINTKCPLADNLQLALWLPHYRAAPPPKLSHPVLRPKLDAHRMYAQDQVVIHTARM